MMYLTSRGWTLSAVTTDPSNCALSTLQLSTQNFACQPCSPPSGTPRSTPPTIPASTVQTNEDGIGVRALLCGKLTNELVERLPLAARPHSPDTTKVDLWKIHRPFISPVSA